jgi:hypothetical protein
VLSSLTRNEETVARMLAEARGAKTAVATFIRDNYAWSDFTAD